jgi:AcrR family transcriptional regulator
MLSTVGRPKEHDDNTRAALLAAAEQIVEKEGVDALSVRRVADDVGTTTRAVYSVFGSKEGLLVALGARAFELLARDVGGQRLTADHVRNLAVAGLGFRKFALAHPALFRLGVQRMLPDPALAADFATTAASTFDILVERVRRFAEAEHLDIDTRTTAMQYHALCEGLAAVELRGMMGFRANAERVWRDALAALVEGLRPG